METTVQSPALVMRILKLAFIVSGFLFIFVMFVIPPPGPPAARQFQFAIAAMGLISLAAGFFVPRLVTEAARPAVENRSLEIERGRWLTRGILSLAFFEACILCGFMVHMLGGSVRIVALLFAAGIAAEIFWSPGNPPGGEQGESVHG